MHTDFVIVLRMKCLCYASVQRKAAMQSSLTVRPMQCPFTESLTSTTTRWSLTLLTTEWRTPYETHLPAVSYNAWCWCWKL